ncbi:hypothetical protein NLU13_0958 [Sarocladium strictum]|uniref:DUF221-domain-containing protein n=1 Tax=Sarocladium strictum TaxID=5046 RepID=A0AA39LBS6_SARSR|nr:hypothetical protein NLU13_0958 [Sarocladium strictum]
MLKPNASEQCKAVDPYPKNDRTGKDLEVQLVLAFILGLFALLSFCTLRPRWPSLYAARKRRLDRDVALPELTDSFVGWMPRLWRITEEQVLAAAGLDAFVFLAFFKMAIRLFAIMAFFAMTVLLPINAKFDGKDPFGIPPIWKNGTRNDTNNHIFFDFNSLPAIDDVDAFKGGNKDRSSDRDHWYLWSHTVFTYFFAALTIYYINRETFRVIRYRQDYLGTQSTVTDRTFRLTGIPESLRSEDGIKHLIEKLDIGQVDSVTICRDWAEIDTLVEQRNLTLRKLETAWAKYRQDQKAQQKESGSRQRSNNVNARSSEPDEEAGENGQLLQENHDGVETERPHVKLRYGFLGLRHRKVDAIDYYEEKLRRLDEKITEVRKKDFKATDMALVTMDTVASCQMVTQARIDPRPGQLLTKPTPAPSDIVWKNTYSPRGIRRLKSWGVTILITFITLIFFIPTAALSSLLSLCAIEKTLPSFANWLSQNTTIYSLLQNGVPTLIISLLNVAVPYLYDWLSNHQGMISQGDVELSLISKNFFFIFFNTFFIFATSSTIVEFWANLPKFVKDTSFMAEVIAAGVRKLSIFYANFIILQGIGLMPFRLLEAGTVALTPIYRLLSKTPRDRAELATPPIFQYGFYLPTALLVFNLCLIYSVLAGGFVILIFGIVYFALGYSTFKYMVLYAMDQPQHATGGAWRIICYRLLVGVIVFEIVMIGSIASKQAIVPSIAILPLLPLTVWYSYYFKRRFEPLTKYIALRAIRADEDPEDAAALDDDFEAESVGRPSQGLLRRGSTIDEHREKGLMFVNPSMVVALPQPWIYDEPPPTVPNEETETDDDGPRLILPGLGEDNVWSAGGS